MAYHTSQLLHCSLSMVSHHPLLDERLIVEENKLVSQRFAKDYLKIGEITFKALFVVGLLTPGAIHA